MSKHFINYDHEIQNIVDNQARSMKKNTNNKRQILIIK